MSAADSDLEKRIQALEDRNAIEDIIVQYGRGVDDDNNELVANCFSDDAEMNIGDLHAGPGGKAIADFLDSLRGSNTFEATHLFTNISYEIDGDVAKGRNDVVAYTVRGEPGSQLVHLRQVYYLDDFVRTDKGWRIAKREHMTKWECTAPSVPLTVLTVKEKTQ